MAQKTKAKPTLSDQLFKLKQSNNQTGYLSFSLAQIHYAINAQNIINIMYDLNLVYLSHMSPPILGMQYYNRNFIPVLDFGGYQPYDKNHSLLILSETQFRNSNLFGLIVDDINEMLYFKQKDLTRNNAPFDNLLPAYYCAASKSSIIHLIDVHDLANQIE